MKVLLVIFLVVTSGKFNISCLYKKKTILPTDFYFLQHIGFFFVVMSMVTIRNVEARLLLHKKTPQIMLHLKASPQVVKREDLHCRRGCSMGCFSINRINFCFCVC